MKKFLKEITPAIILSFVASFMLYIYEPILTYSTNIDDFWFDFKLMIPNILLFFIILFSGLLLIYLLLYFIFCVVIKKSVIYKTILIISFLGFIYTYIQGNYLIGSLPLLDGTTIVWNSFLKDNIISLCVILVLAVLEIVFIVKLKIDKTIKINKIATLIIFGMLLASLISILFTPGMYREKIIATATNRNINNASQDKNFFIFLADAVDSSEFSKVLQESSEFEATFDDFTYYPDTISTYVFTRDSIPFIFSGIWNKNEKEFSEYYNEAFSNSGLLNRLKEQNYDMNFYEYQIHWSSRNAKIFSNIDIYNDQIDRFSLFKELTKYILFKYLPYPLKSYSKIETANFDNCKIDQNQNYFSWDNDVAYNLIKNNDLEIVDNKYFQFFHIEGAHTPFNYDENVNRIPEEQGTYAQKAKATLRIIDTFLNRLKENNVYDNSVIIVMADHGYWGDGHGRQNPILFIKGINEHHQMETSDLPLSYEDLPDAYQLLLDDKESKDLFQNIDTNRIRKFIYNEFEGEDHMIEYEQRGKAWDGQAAVETGEIFDR